MIVMDIPLNAEVQCADGPGGRSTSVVLHPTTKRVTHLVVREASFPHTEWLVPVDLVLDATPTSIRLRCTRHELRQLEPFIVPDGGGGDSLFASYAAGAWLMNPGFGPEALWLPLEPLDHENVPAGDLVVRRGERVDATDGHVGRADEFLMEPTTGHITHLVLREGHLWGQKEVTIPVAQIDRIDAATIYLKLDKHAVEALPTLPVGHQRR